MTTTTVRFTEEDRDSRGFIRLSPPDVAEMANDAPTSAVPVSRPAAKGLTPLSPRLRYQLTIYAASVAGLLLVLLTMRMSAPRAISPVSPIPTSASVPSLAPTVDPTPPPVAMLLAYGAPNEAPRWEIEATRAITPVAHFGADWIQADVSGSGRIWLRAADLPTLAIVGPDLAPRPMATALPYVPTAELQPPCLMAGTGAETVTVCDWLEPEQLRIAAAQKWAATYGGNIGTVLTPSPQVRIP